jgi:hypothetical protein
MDKQIHGWTQEWILLLLSFLVTGFLSSLVTGFLSSLEPEMNPTTQTSSLSL